MRYSLILSHKFKGTKHKTVRRSKELLTKEDQENPQLKSRIEERSKTPLLSVSVISLVSLRYSFRQLY